MPPHDDGHPPKPPPKGPAAGGTGDKPKKQSLAEWIADLKAQIPVISKAFTWMGDRAEDHTQSAANGGSWAVAAIILTTFTTLLCSFSDTDRLMVVNVAWWSAVWCVGPFVGFCMWRSENRRIHANEMERAR